MVMSSSCRQQGGHRGARRGRGRLGGETSTREGSRAFFPLAARVSGRGRWADGARRVGGRGRGPGSSLDLAKGLEGAQGRGKCMELGLNHEKEERREKEKEGVVPS
jgi:hypothetical protein